MEAMVLAGFLFPAIQVAFVVFSWWRAIDALCFPVCECLLGDVRLIALLCVCGEMRTCKLRISCCQAVCQIWSKPVSSQRLKSIFPNSERAFSSGRSGAFSGRGSVVQEHDAVDPDCSQLRVRFFSVSMIQLK